MTQPPTLSPDDPASSPDPGTDVPEPDGTENAPVRAPGPPDGYEPL